MNKKITSLLVVFVTAFTVGIMLYTSNIRENQKNNDDKLEVLTNNKKKINKETIITNENLKKKTFSEKQQLDSNNNNVKEDGLNTKNTVSKNTKGTENVSTKQSYENNNSEGNPYPQSNDDDNNYEANNTKSDITVFKVSKEKIQSELTFTDKAKIFEISRNLSPRDFETLQEDINNDDEKQGISDAMQLLRKRLDDKDFNKVKEIAGKFINLDVVEN